MSDVLKGYCCSDCGTQVPDVHNPACDRLKEALLRLDALEKRFPCGHRMADMTNEGGNCAYCSAFRALVMSEEMREKAESRLQGAVNLVNAQAEDDGLWFIAENASEAYLQQELRKLHAAIESPTPPPEVDSKSRLKRIAIQRGESGEDAYRGKSDGPIDN